MREKLGEFFLFVISLLVLSAVHYLTDFENAVIFGLAVITSKIIKASIDSEY